MPHDEFHVIEDGLGSPLPVEPVEVAPGSVPVQVPDNGGANVGPAVVTNLSQMMFWRAYPYQRNGVTYTEWASYEQTVGVNKNLSSQGFGYSKHIRAKCVYNRSRGAMQVAIMNDEQIQSIGGFLNSGGRTRAGMPVVVRGTVTIWSSDLECILS